MTYLLSVNFVNIRFALFNPSATSTRVLIAVKLGIDIISVFQITCNFAVVKIPHKFCRLIIIESVMFNNFSYSHDDVTCFRISTASHAVKFLVAHHFVREFVFISHNINLQTKSLRLSHYIYVYICCQVYKKIFSAVKILYLGFCQMSRKIAAKTVFNA